MDNLNNDQIQELILNKFQGSVTNFNVPFDLPTFTLENKTLINTLLDFLKNDSKLNFNFLTTLCGVHYPKEKTLSVIYHLHNLSLNKRIRIKVNLSDETPEIDSVTAVFPGANWMERETYDFYGIKFNGHPNLKRILNMEDLTVFPMRKEYPLEDPNRTDKDDAQFGR